METSEQPRATGLGPMWAVAQLTLREANRSRFLPVTLVLLSLLVAALPRLVLFAFGEEQRVASELGLATMRLAVLLTGLAVAVAVAGDHARGTVFTLRPRPLGPLAYAAGRWAGGVLIAGALVTMLSAAQALTLSRAAQITPARWVGPIGIGLEGGVIVAIAVLCGHAFPPAAAALATYAAFCAGHLHGHLLDALQHGSAIGAHLGGPLGVLLPDLSAFGGAQAPLGAADLLPSLGLAFPPIVAYLSLSAALATWREPITPRERG